MRLYGQAAALGCRQAHRKIGEIYENVAGNPDAALEEYKRGVQRGEHGCYAAMALLFRKLRNYVNEPKCWDKFFDGVLQRLEGVKQMRETLRCMGPIPAGQPRPSHQVLLGGDWRTLTVWWQTADSTIIDIRGTRGSTRWSRYWLCELSVKDVSDIYEYLVSALHRKQEVPSRHIEVIRVGCAELRDTANRFRDLDSSDAQSGRVLAWLDAEFPPGVQAR